MKRYFYLVLLLVILFINSSCAKQESINLNSSNENFVNGEEPIFQNKKGVELDNRFFLEDLDVTEYTKIVYDPLEPVNKWVFNRNDEAYRNALIPTKELYTSLTHEFIQIGVSNFYNNLGAPVRIIGNLLLLRIGDAGLEFFGFFINTISSLGGYDIFTADNDLKNIGISDVLKEYGIPEGYYIVWPIIGPSTLRSTVGKVGDIFISLPTYLISGPAVIFLETTKILTQTNYEYYLDGYKFSLDPYTGFRTATLE